MRARRAALIAALTAAALWSTAPPPASLRAAGVAAAADAIAPAPAERQAILDAVRARVPAERALPGRLRVRYLSARGGWAYLRAGAQVRVEGEWQETDGDVAALLRRAPLERPAWAVVEIWTLAEEHRRPFAAFARRVRARERSEGIPEAVIPTDLLAP
jgi:hypothetical protein